MNNLSVSWHSWHSMRLIYSKTPFVTFLCLLLLALCTQGVLSAPLAYITVEVREDGIFIEGKPVARNSTLSDYDAILGKPDRTTLLENKIYTYDELGILLYKKPEEASILSISLGLIKADYAFSPKKTFKGILVVADRALRINFPQSALPRFSEVKIDANHRTLEFPVTKIIYGKNSLILEYLVSRRTLGGVGISWLE